MKIRIMLSIAMAAIFGLTACAQAPKTSSEGVTLIIRFEANDQGVDELSRILAEVPDAMASEPGFVSAKVYQNASSPSIFVLEEVWETRALHEEHFDRINASGDWAHINTLLISEPEKGYYDLVRQ